MKKEETIQKTDLKHELELSEPGVGNLEEFLNNLSKRQDPESVSFTPPGTFLLIKFGKKGKWRIHAFGDKRTVHSSLEEPSNVRTRKLRSDYKFKVNVWTNAVLVFVRGIIKEIRWRFQNGS